MIEIWYQLGKAPQAGLGIEFVLFIICGALLSTVFIIGARSSTPKKESWERSIDRKLERLDAESRERKAKLEREIKVEIPERPKKQSRYY
jgi:hypothetical protein